MARPLRIEFPGAIYHVTARGDRREDIFGDDADRQQLLDVLAQALDRFDAQVLAYCLMSNHYHLVLYTRQANLSKLMRQVNGVYTQGGWGQVLRLAPYLMINIRCSPTPPSQAANGTARHWRR
jgi:REP element-mobilizing transposase RayT